MTDGDTTSGGQHATSHPAGAELLPDLARELADARAQIAHLKSALDRSRGIGIAMGILVERHKITQDEALTILVRASRQTHRKLHDLTHDLICTGQLPEPHRPAPRPSLPAGAVAITTRRYGTQWRVTARGDLDLSACDELATAIHQGLAIASEVEDIVIDVGAVTFLDCSCLGVLAHARAAAARSAVSLTLVNIPPCVGRLLKLTDLIGLAEPPASRARPSLN